MAPWVYLCLRRRQQDGNHKMKLEGKKCNYIYVNKNEAIKKKSQKSLGRNALKGNIVTV